MTVREGAFWPELSRRAQPGEVSASGRKMEVVRDGLKDLRRVRRDKGQRGAGNATQEEQEEEQVEDIGKDEDEDGALIYRILKDLSDTLEDLQALEDQLVQGLSPVQDNGGSRHATAVITERTLAVVRRKATLVQSVETRAAGLEAARAQFGELVPGIMSGEIEPPQDLKGIKKFAQKHTHSPGNPADANKSDFKSFASSFKLPYWHQALSNMRELGDKIGEWWADACLTEAKKGSNHDGLERLFDVATGTGVDADHPKLRQARKVVNDRLADRVLRDAEEFQERDRLLAERHKVPPVGPASTAADSIEGDINGAIKEGVPANDQRMTKAKQIVKSLREADGQRKRLANREATKKAHDAQKAPSGLPH